MSDLVAAVNYFRKAERALHEARILLREESPEGACSRAYYAMHDAAHAALFAGGFEKADAIIKTHHGLLAEFGKRIVQTGKVDVVLGRALNRMQDIRIAADYGSDAPLLTDAQAAIQKAEQFLEAIRHLIGPAQS